MITRTLNITGAPLAPFCPGCARRRTSFAIGPMIWSTCSETREDGIAVVTFHPQVIGRGHRLLALERWLDELGRMGVAFARCEDVARQFLTGRAYGTYRPST